MIIKLDSNYNRHLKRAIQHIVYIIIILILVPGFFYVEICIVLPAVVDNEMACLYHTVVATYLLINIVGNMIYGMFINTTIKGKFLTNVHNSDWSMCSVCECLRPPRAWHCDICDICVLKRDHHCTFLACCVGYFNFRYFILFTLYVFVAMLYAFYFNVQFLAQFITWNHGLAVMKFLFPLVNFVVDSGFESLYIFLVVINLLVGFFTGFLFFYHFNNVLQGRTTPEKKLNAEDFLYNKGWKDNLIEVFGSKWYLTWLWPFIQSPLPGDGIHWSKKVKSK